MRSALHVPEMTLLPSKPSLCRIWRCLVRDFELVHGGVTTCSRDWQSRFPHKNETRNGECTCEQSTSHWPSTPSHRDRSKFELSETSYSRLCILVWKSRSRIHVEERVSVFLARARSQEEHHGERAGDDSSQLVPSPWIMWLIISEIHCKSSGNRRREEFFLHPHPCDYVTDSLMASTRLREDDLGAEQVKLRQSSWSA